MHNYLVLISKHVAVMRKTFYFDKFKNKRISVKLALLLIYIYMYMYACMYVCMYALDTHVSVSKNNMR